MSKVCRMRGSWFYLTRATTPIWSSPMRSPGRSPRFYKSSANVAGAMDRPMNWWIRGYLLFAAVQGFGIGLTGLVVPSEMQIPLRITPLNTRFVAALYVAGGIGVIMAALSKRRSEARLFVVGFGVATLLILILTLLHWSDFMGDPLPHRAVWIFVYVVDPLVALVMVPLAGLWPPAHGRRHALSRLLM